MKVFIWQQFSSNHSNSYVVIGEFKSIADTENAATTMKQILKQIYDWYADETNKALADDVRHIEAHPPTPAENQIATQYNVTFDYAMDWIARQKDTTFIDDAVVTLSNHLFIASTHQTTSTDTQFTQLINKLGGTITYDEDMIEKAGLAVDISCLAPNEKTAETIATAVRTYLHRDKDSYWLRPPWVLYYDGKLASQPEQTSAEIEIFIEYEQAMRDWRVQNRNNVEGDKLVRDLHEAYRNRDTETAEVLNELLHDMYKHVQPQLDPDREAVIRKILYWTTIPLAYEISIPVTVDDKQIKIRNLSLLHDAMGRNIKAIVAWLEAQGCENVLYQFDIYKYH